MEQNEIIRRVAKVSPLAREILSLTALKGSNVCTTYDFFLQVGKLIRGGGFTMQGVHLSIELYPWDSNQGPG